MECCCAKLATKVLCEARLLKWTSLKLTTFHFDNGARSDKQAYSDHITEARLEWSSIPYPWIFEAFMSAQIRSVMHESRLNQPSSGIFAESVLCSTITTKHSHVKYSATERLGESRPSILRASHSSAILPDPARLSLGDSDVGLALWGLGEAEAGTRREVPRNTSL